MPGPIPLQPSWAYGPVDSRRLGRSLGVNLLPTDRRICNMNCVYCQYEPPQAGAATSQLPSPEQVLSAVGKALRRSPDCDAITIAGNGEPTLHPRFEEIVAGLVDLRDRMAPQAKLCLLSNATVLDRPRVLSALELIDRPIFKLDAGDDATLHTINRPRAGTDLETILANLVALPRYTLQALFVTGRFDNASPKAVQAWLEQIILLAPSDVQVTTIDRGTAHPGLLPVPATRLEQIAARVRAAGIPAEAFPCRDEARFHEEG